jgi:hypothetical protein
MGGVTWGVWAVCEFAEAARLGFAAWRRKVASTNDGTLAGRSAAGGGVGSDDRKVKDRTRLKAGRARHPRAEKQTKEKADSPHKSRWRRVPRFARDDKLLGVGVLCRVPLSWLKPRPTNTRARRSRSLASLVMTVWVVGRRFVVVMTVWVVGRGDCRG